jgi:hypothetical protein
MYMALRPSHFSPPPQFCSGCLSRSLRHTSSQPPGSLHPYLQLNLKLCPESSSFPSRSCLQWNVCLLHTLSRKAAIHSTLLKIHERLLVRHTLICRISVKAEQGDKSESKQKKKFTRTLSSTFSFPFNTNAETLPQHRLSPDTNCYPTKLLSNHILIHIGLSLHIFSQFVPHNN